MTMTDRFIHHCYYLCIFIFFSRPPRPYPMARGKTTTTIIIKSSWWRQHRRSCTWDSLSFARSRWPMPRAYICRVRRARTHSALNELLHARWQHASLNFRLTLTHRTNRTAVPVVQVVVELSTFRRTHGSKSKRSPTTDERSLKSCHEISVRSTAAPRRRRRRHHNVGDSSAISAR